MRISDWSSDVCSSDLAPIAEMEDMVPLRSLHQRLQCQHMGTRQIRHMDIIANPGPIRRGIVSTKDADMAAFAQRCFYRHLDEVGCPRCRLSGATLRISARHIEIAQGAEVEIMRP